MCEHASIGETIVWLRANGFNARADRVERNRKAQMDALLRFDPSAIGGSVKFNRILHIEEREK